MSKVGKTMNSVAENVVKAGGVVTKRGGEVISEIGKKVGVSKEVCNKVEDKADMLGKDMYYASRKIGNKVEDKADMLGKDMYHATHKIGDKVEDVAKDIVDGTKKVYDNVANKLK